MVKFLSENRDDLKSKTGNKVRIAQFATIASICVLTGVIAVLQNYTVAVSVSYEDKEVGLVMAESNVQTATEIIKDNVIAKNQDKKENIKIEPTTNLVLTKKENVISEQQLADNIIDNSSDVVKGEALYVDGDLYAVVDNNADIDKTLDGILKEHETGQEEEKIEFDEDVEIIKGIFLTEETVDEKTLEDKVKDKKPIPIAKSYKEVKVEEVPFETEYVESNDYIVGTRIIEQAGDNGVVEYKEKVTEVDNNEKGRQLVNQDLLKQPTKQKIIVGTASLDDPNAILADENGNQFVIPLQGSYVSSPYGYRYGSSHKGVDLCVRGGTLGKPVLSTAKGVVEEVLQTNESGGYGIKVTVNHGNNIKSVYAHLDRADVKEGQVLESGQQLGLAGNTGDSYGAHLHFELRINDTVVDPMRFVK